MWCCCAVQKVSERQSQQNVRGLGNRLAAASAVPGSEYSTFCTRYLLQVGGLLGVCTPEVLQFLELLVFPPEEWLYYQFGRHSNNGQP